VVFFSGKVTSPLDASLLTTEKLGELIGGMGWPELTATGKWRMKKNIWLNFGFQFCRNNFRLDFYYS